MFKSISFKSVCKVKKMFFNGTSLFYILIQEDAQVKELEEVSFIIEEDVCRILSIHKASVKFDNISNDFSIHLFFDS